MTISKNLGLTAFRNVLIVAKEDLIEEDPLKDPTLYQQLTDGQKR